MEHIRVFEISMFMLLFVSFSCATSLIVPSFNITAPITKLASDPYSMDLYIGGENFVASLSLDLELIFFLSIGPVQEKEYCYPNPAPCSNTVQVLEIDELFNKLIVCGSAYGGTCTMHSIPDICDWMCVDSSTNASQSNVASACGNHQMTTHFLSPRKTDFESEPTIEFGFLWSDCRSENFAPQCNFFNPSVVDNSVSFSPNPQSYAGRRKKRHGSEKKDVIEYHRDATKELLKASKIMRDETLVNKFQSSPFGGSIDGEPWDDSFNSFGNAFESRLIVACQQEYVGVDMPLQPMISMRYITHVMDESFLMVYPGEVDDQQPLGVYVDKDKTQRFNIDFKLSFSRGDFSYLLSVQKGYCSYGVDGPQSFCTMLSRVNNSSPSLLPYIEIPLNCRHGGMDFPFLTAATFGYIGFQGSDYEEVPLLVLAFGRGDNGDTDPNPQHGTAICAYSLTTLDKEEFGYVEESCKLDSDMSTPPKWCIDSREPCQYIRAASFGGNQGALTFIPRALVPTLITYTPTVTKDTLTSYVDKMYLYTVTQYKTFFRVNKEFELEVKKVFSRYNIGGKPPEPGSGETITEKHMKQPKYSPVGRVDHWRAMLYLTYGEQVFALSLDFCRQYTSCAVCQQYGGRQCHWCPSENLCVDNAIDSCQSSSDGKCPPRLSGFEPRTVPVAGGSSLTIRGTHLGNQEANVTVTLCGELCDNVIANVNSLSCTVRQQPKCVFCSMCFVRITVSGSRESSGIDSSSSKLIYVTPNITLFDPLFGPVSGGTLLEVWGEHLMAGSERRIEVAGVECQIVPLDWDKEEEKLTCRMGDAFGLENTCGRVKVVIDNYEVEAGFYEYCFKPDPIITSIKPQSTIESGGIKLRVTGKHFNSTPRVNLLLFINSTSFIGKCTGAQDGEALECITPNIRDATKLTFADRPDKRLIRAIVALDVGGTIAKSPTESYFSVYRDPIIFPLSSDSANSFIHGELKDKIFTIQGRFIPYWMDYDSIVIMIGETRCDVIDVDQNNIFCDVTKVLQAYRKDLRQTTTVLPFNTTNSDNKTDPNTPLLRNATVEITTAALRTSPNTPSAATQSSSDPANINITTKSPIQTNETSRGSEFLDFLESKRHRASPRASPRITLREPMLYKLTIRFGNLEQNVGFVSVGRLFTYPEEVPKQGKQSYWIAKMIAIIVGTAVGFIILTAMFFYCIRRKEHAPQEHPFYMGSLSGRSDGSHLGSGEPAIPSLTQILHSVLQPEKRDEATNLIIGLDQLTLGKRVGSGNFGCVYEATLRREKEQPMKVAVKTLQDSVSHSINLADFVQEAVIMMDFYHENVLGLVGLAEKEPGVPYVILPYMENGDLLTYVRDHKRSLSLYDVVQFGADICSGMSYLSSLKFVHRDLAARNCMLDMHYRVKVADFGLCRDIYEKGYYTSDNKKKLPIRWMAVESIENGAYSTKSDVWSMGVVMWELLTRGMTPYPGVDGWDIINFLRRRRLAPPYYCPENLYRLMMNCWTKEPARRPSFKALQKELLLMIGMEVASTPNTPEPKRNMKIFPLNNEEISKIVRYENRIDDSDNNDIPKIKISQDDISASDLSVEIGCDDGYTKLAKNKDAGSVMSLPRLNLIKNVKIIIPTCYEFKDVKKEAVATYLQIIDNYEPAPRFANPFLRSKKKRNKSSKKSKDKNSKELSVVNETRTSKTNSGGYCIPSGTPMPVQARSLISRAGSEGQLIDACRKDSSYNSKFLDGSPYYELEHGQRASAASILDTTSCHSSVFFDKTGSTRSFLAGSGKTSSMASVASSGVSCPSSRPHSNMSHTNANRYSTIPHPMDKDRSGSIGRSSLKNEDIIEI